jgi:hypothetical protein
MNQPVSIVADGCTMSIAGVWNSLILGSSNIIGETLKKKLYQLQVTSSLKTTC